MQFPISRREFFAPLAVALGGLAVWAVPGSAAPVDAAPEKGKPIDVVICLDVSNSMDGLINAAKGKLWDIVNELAKVKPTPQLRVGLYSYGNDGYDAKIGWIRKEADLTNDLDEIYKKLNGLTTNGGTEYVSRVCRDAIVQQKWSDDKGALKLIFVCGNEPASQDPEVKLKPVADMAIAKGIVINPIFAGSPNEEDARDWKEFAQMAKGKFAAIDQDKGTVVIDAPQDKELAALSGKLNKTYVAYGKSGKDFQANQVVQDGNAEKQQGAAAARCVTKANDLYRNDSWDLVDRMKNDKNFDVKKLKDDELSDELKKMKPEEREKFVKQKAAERDELQKRINELATKRQQYIAEYMKKNPSKADQAFDVAIRKTLCEQAAAKGIQIPQ